MDADQQQRLWWEAGYISMADNSRTILVAESIFSIVSYENPGLVTT
jgi:hypothetical protein